MSVFGPKQVEELIVGNAVAAETTIATFLASASDQEIKVLSADGTAPALGDDFKVLQKTASGYEFSDVVKADKVKKVILKEYAAETQKSVVLTVGSAVANTTYVVEVRLYNDGGTLSPENFAVISGYWKTGATPGSVTDIADGLVASINANLSLRGGKELTVSNVAGVITITGQYQNVVPGKIIGKQIEFDAVGKSFDETAVVLQNGGLITTTSTTAAYPGAGTGKYAVNLEWFTKGYKYEVYRQTGYPADFPYTQYTNEASNYNAIHIKYFDDRDDPSVEKQDKVLTILVVRTDLASNANTNAVLADLRTVLGSGAVPGDLDIV